MNAISHFADAVATLVARTWAETDVGGEMLDWQRRSGRAEDQYQIIANLIDEADPDAPFDVVMAARSRLVDEADAWLDARDRERRDMLADAVDAGDCDWAGNVVPYRRYP